LPNIVKFPPALLTGLLLHAPLSPAPERMSDKDIENTRRI